MTKVRGNEELQVTKARWAGAVGGEGEGKPSPGLKGVGGFGDRVGHLHALRPRSPRRIYIYIYIYIRSYFGSSRGLPGFAVDLAIAPPCGRRDRRCHFVSNSFSFVAISCCGFRHHGVMAQSVHAQAGYTK